MVACWKASIPTNSSLISKNCRKALDKWTSEPIWPMVFGQHPRASELEYAGSLSRLISDFTADMFTTGNFSRYVNITVNIPFYSHSIPIQQDLGFFPSSCSPISRRLFPSIPRAFSRVSCRTNWTYWLNLTNSWSWEFSEMMWSDPILDIQQ